MKLSQKKQYFKSLVKCLLGWISGFSRKFSSICIFRQCSESFSPEMADRKFENFYLLTRNIPFFWFMFRSGSFHHSPSYIIWFYWTTSILHIQFGPFNNNFIVAWSNRKFWCCQWGSLFNLTRFGNAGTFIFTILTKVMVFIKVYIDSKT